MRPEFFGFLALYLCALLAIGLKFSRRMKTLEDYFLASRSLPAWLIFLSLTASWFGATSILVTTDDAYRRGLSAAWLVGVPAIVTVLLFGVFLAGPIRRLEVITLPDLVEKRYGKTVRHLAAFLIFWYMVVLASSQMVALGQFLGPFLDVPYIWSLAAGTAVVLVYLLRGGLFSVVATDVFQVLLLTGGVLGLAVHLGRLTPAAGVLSPGGAAADGLFNPFANIRSDLLIALSFVLAWTISPIAWQRVQAAGTVKKARLGFLAAAGAFVILYGLVVFIGISAKPVFGSRELNQPLISDLILSGAGRWLGGILFVAVVAAILSTLDTAINTGALTLTRDVYVRVLARRSGGRLPGVGAGRAATVFMAVLAFLVATRFQSILEILGLSSEIMAEGLFVPGIAMIWLRGRRPLAGGLSLALGGGFALAGFLSALNALPVWLPSWPDSVPYGVGLSLAGFIVGYALDSLRLRRSAGESALE
jgi:solute:Na+ symporter, SSS family